MTFTHLAIRSEYAITDSIIRIKDLVAKARADGQQSLGIADLSNTFAVVKFYKACVGAGIKPLIGSEVVIGDNADSDSAKAHQSVILYAMDNTGYKNLLSLVSKSYTDGLVDGVPILTKTALFENHQGIIVILTERSEIGTTLKGNQPKRVQDTLAQWQQIFGDRLYIGIKRTKRAAEDLFIKNAIEQATPLAIPLVAYNDVRFLSQDDFDAHEARVCIADGYVLADQSRPHNYSDEQYFKTSEAMMALFADIPLVIENTNALASRCNVILTLGKNVLPDFPVPEGQTIDSYFKQLSFDGLYQRLEHLYPIEQRDHTWDAKQKDYEDRLNYELDIISQMGFAGYFLIVMDFIRWAKDNGVPVGPGRGSGAGSLIAYSLNITDLDPLRYELLFERFLNPERISMPDFDIDFCIEGRDRVIDYVAQKYGRDAVSQIITFGTMAAKAVVRDVARVQGKPYGLADKISKLIPKKPDMTLALAVESEPQLRELLYNPDAFDHEDAVEIWEMALKLEGTIRNVGKHAGGVLIAPNRISDFSAVYCDSDGNRMSQFDKDDVEAVGLVKFDFLGLRNLTVIKAALDNINQTRAKQQKAPLDLEQLPLDDKNVYQSILQHAKTTAVFQLESSGMKKYLTKLKPSNIEDVIAMCALYRPGPLDAGMVEIYIDRKHGVETFEYDHESLESILSNTYGVIVYQEQVMQIAQSLAGYTLGQADILRRAMGKKKAEEMAEQRSIFANGAIKQGISEKLATDVFDLMEKFASYGFNKSHSAAYGVLAYQTAYLKHYYPAEFMAAVLSSEMNNTDAVVFLIGDCEDNFNLKVLPPSVNQSQWHFVVKDKKTILYGLGAVKGVGEMAVESIVQARQQGGEFRDLYDFCNRVDIKKVGKRTLEALVKAGCFDDLAQNLRPEYQDRPYEIRGALWEQLPQAMQAADQNRQNALAGTFDLFNTIDDSLTIAPPLSDVIWSNKTRLKNEMDTLGLYLTGHPIDDYKDELTHYGIVKLAKLSATGFKQYVWFAGLIIDIANFGNRVAISVDDGTARIEMSCFSDKFSQLKHTLKIGDILLFKGSVRENEGRTFTRLQHAITLTDARLRFMSGLHIKLHQDDVGRLTQIINVLHNDKKNTPPPTPNDNEPISDGKLPLALYLYNDIGIGKIAVNEQFRLTPNDDNLITLKQLLHDSFKVSYI